MRKEVFLTDTYSSLEEAAKMCGEYLWRCEKTEELIKALAQHDYYMLWNEHDIDRCIRETGVFEFTLDDVIYAHDIAEDEYMLSVQKTIDYLMREMIANCKPEERYAFYATNIKPHIEDREKYLAMFKHNYSNLAYYRIAE